MLLTRIKKKPSALKNGVYIGSIFSIKEIPKRIIIIFKVGNSQIGLELPLSAETLLKLGQIAYLGGIKEKEDIHLSSFINLKLKLTISGGKIIKLQSPSVKYID